MLAKLVVLTGLSIIQVLGQENVPQPITPGACINYFDNGRGMMWNSCDNPGTNMTYYEDATTTAQYYNHSRNVDYTIKGLVCRLQCYLPNDHGDLLQCNGEECP